MEKNDLKVHGIDPEKIVDPCLPPNNRKSSNSREKGIADFCKRMTSARLTDRNSETSMRLGALRIAPQASSSLAGPVGQRAVVRIPPLPARLTGLGSLAKPSNELRPPHLFSPRPFFLVFFGVFPCLALRYESLPVFIRIKRAVGVHAPLQKRTGVSAYFSLLSLCKRFKFPLCGTDANHRSAI